MLDDVHSEPPITRDDLRPLTPLSVREDIPPPERLWSEQDWLRICRGHKSTDMDDKWDAFVEGQRLYFHRSWTGMGVYEAQFVQVADGWQISCAVVEGDRSTYRRQDDAYESALLEALIDGKLCGVYDGPGHQRLARARTERDAR
jgi:hypothetical protein